MLSVSLSNLRAPMSPETLFHHQENAVITNLFTKEKAEKIVPCLDSTVFDFHLGCFTQKNASV